MALEWCKVASSFCFCSFNALKSIEILNLKSRKFHNANNILCSHSVLLLFFCRLCLLFLSLLPWSPRCDFVHLWCTKCLSTRTKEGPKHLVDLIETHWIETYPSFVQINKKSMPIIRQYWTHFAIHQNQSLFTTGTSNESLLRCRAFSSVETCPRKHFPPPKKTWRNTLCCIFIPLTSPMSQLISYWLMQNLEPSGKINTTILTVCRLRTGKSTCGKKRFLSSELKRCDFELPTVSL